MARGDRLAYQGDTEGIRTAIRWCTSRIGEGASYEGKCSLILICSLIEPRQALELCVREAQQIFGG
jgi:hypothetical protein